MSYILCRLRYGGRYIMHVEYLIYSRDADEEEEVEALQEMVNRSFGGGWCGVFGDTRKKAKQ